MHDVAEYILRSLCNFVALELPSERDACSSLEFVTLLYLLKPLIENDMHVFPNMTREPG